MFRCIVNEGDKDEFMVAGNTREEVERILNESLLQIRTKRFFKIKPDHETSGLTLDGSTGLVPNG